MDDIYPSSDWNFVFGQSLPAQGCVILSFARYDPALVYSLSDAARADSAPLSLEEQQILFQRAAKVPPIHAWHGTLVPQAHRCTHPPTHPGVGA